METSTSVLCRETVRHRPRDPLGASIYEKMNEMIQLQRLNGQEVFVNPDLIRVVEVLPDTVIRFTDGQQLLVREKPEEISRKVIEFKRACQSPDKWV